MQKVPLEDEENALADTRSHVGTGRPFEIRGSGEKRQTELVVLHVAVPSIHARGNGLESSDGCCPGLEKALFGGFHKQVGGLLRGSLVSGGVELFSSGVGFPFLSGGGGGGGACLEEETFECTGMKPL